MNAQRKQPHKYQAAAHYQALALEALEYAARTRSYLDDLKARAEAYAQANPRPRAVFAIDCN